MNDDSYYELLGVEPSASRDDLRSAYRSRVEKLEAAREGKGVTDSSLQANREETARVRTAWNVLSDPFQRQRYDAQLSGPVDADGSADADGDDDAGTEPGSEVALTGWRKLLAPPPPKQPRNGAAAGGKDGKTPPPARRAPQPTIPLPAGVTLAETRPRGMALMFDISILLLMYLAISLVLPGVIQSDYSKINDQITACNNVNSDAKSASKSDFRQCNIDKSTGTHKAQESKASKNADKLNKDIQGTKIAISVIALIAMLLYCVPSTALTGKTLGMRRTKIHVLRVDGTPAGWIPSFSRYLIPLAVALFVPSLGPVLGLGLVLWGFRDRNKQGIHDKLAKTIVVNDQL